MENKIDKSAIHSAFVKQQTEMIESFESRLKALEDDATSHNQIASQTEDRAAGKIEMIIAMENELIFAQKEKSNLESIDPTIEKNKVDIGALVMTNNMNFFIAISGDKISVDGIEIFGISPFAPIYAVMQGLKKGGSFNFNNKQYMIIEVY